MIELRGRKYTHMKRHDRMLTRLASSLAMLLCFIPRVLAQDVAITNARIIVGSGTVIENGSIVVRGGKIASVSAGKPVSPAGRVIDAKGMSAMPGFIDAHKHINTGPD